MNIDNLILNDLVVGLYRFITIFWICSFDIDRIQFIA